MQIISVRDIENNRWKKKVGVLLVLIVLKQIQTFFLNKGVPSLAMSAFQVNFKFAK